MVEKVELPSGTSPLDFLQAVYMNSQLPLNTRLRAAMAAAPFCHPRLAVVATGNANDLADRLMQALAASGKVINGRAMQVLEASEAS